MVIKMIFKKKDKIQKSKEIIKREQLKIKEEKRKNRLINKIIGRKHPYNFKRTNNINDIF